MSDILREYMDKRFQSTASDISLTESEPSLEKGPVITVSREAGCSGNQFVMELSAFLNKEKLDSKQKEWHWVNKEIIYETARELKVHPNRVQKLFKGEPRGLVDEILDSLSTRYYKNDRIVTKAIGEIVKKIAAQGHIIILGRGGVGLTRHIKRSLHVKLFAPLDWRINKIKHKLNLPREEAESFVHTEDQKRDALIKKFCRSDHANEIFDLMFNSKELQLEEIFNCISIILRNRNLN